MNTLILKLKTIKKGNILTHKAACTSILTHTSIGFAEYTQRGPCPLIDTTYSILFLLLPDCYFSTSLHTLIPT